jgi:CRP/FNR family cyclic AMP-dependent transcriptional regulator
MKDAIDSLAGLVPGSGAATRPPARPASSRTRSDRPLGKRGTDLLGRVPLFAGLSRRHLRALGGRADQVEFRPGEIIVPEGMRGGAFFVIVDGEARVTRGKRTLAKLGPGDFFGELALLDGGIRTASVVAATPMLCIRIFKRAFDRLIAEEPDVAAKMLSVMAGRVRQAERSPTD